MVITLIGMSNVGKSYWAKKLETEAGFSRYGCDDLIQERILEDPHIDGINNIHDVGAWMGHPYEQQYSENSKVYINHEQQVMRGIIEKLKARNTQNEKIVIDTTGSVIYVADEILTWLRENSQIVHLQTTDSMLDDLIELFAAEPKPLYWSNQFSISPTESETDALIRCYPMLLASREQRYAQYPHVTLSSQAVRKEEWGVNDFLSASV